MSDGNLHGATFEHAELMGARFFMADMTDAHFEHVNMTGVVMRDVELCNVEMTGDVVNVTMNGVDVAPLIEAELDRRHVGRAKMRPTDPAGFREAWTIIERLWDGTVERAKRLPPAMLHESVNGEWSFIETLRHLLFATDAWIGRVLLGNPSPWHPLDLPFDHMKDRPSVPRDRTARPSLDEVVALRKERMGTMRRVLEDLTDEQLNSRTTPVTEPGWPGPDNYETRMCLLNILNEEFQHRLYAERDLEILESRDA